MHGRFVGVSRGARARGAGDGFFFVLDWNCALK